MSQSLEFNGFLEALEIAAPRGNALSQLQQSHRTVVEWIHAAIAGEAHLEEDGLSAGTIVAFRAVGAPPAPAAAERRDDGLPVSVRRVEIAEAVDAALERSDDIERALERDRRRAGGGARGGRVPRAARRPRRARG